MRQGGKEGWSDQPNWTTFKQKLINLGGAGRLLTTSSSPCSREADRATVMTQA